MPLDIAVWRVDDESPVRIALSGMATESQLQEIIAANVSIVEPNLMVIGREVPTAWGSKIDILAIDADGNLVVIELKRSRTPRDIVAQILEYGSWVRHVTSDRVAAEFIKYQRNYLPDITPENIDEAFRKRFGRVPDEINSEHRLIIIASSIDPTTERIVDYLTEDYSVNLDFVLFHAFEDNGHVYLTRTWPDEIASSSEAPVRTDSRLEWNREYYVSFEVSDMQMWNDARKFGFISGGGGDWYVRTLFMLEPGDRVWVYVPSQGYVGVGQVVTTCKRYDEFSVDLDGVATPITNVGIAAPLAFDEEHGEHFVGVKWIKTVDLADAVRERGFFANQNTVARPRSAKWAFTLERLTALWNIDLASTGGGGAAER